MNKKQKDLLLACLLTVGMGLTPAMALAQKVHFSTRTATLSEAIAMVEKQTNLTVDYDANKVNVKKTVNLNKMKGDVRKVLPALLQGTGYGFEIVGSHLILKPATANQGSSARQKGSSEPAPKKKVSGRIVDGNGDPIIGATITERGTNNRTVSDLNGDFSFFVTPGSQVEVSYIGFKDKMLRPSDNMNVAMEEDTEGLDEVVVVGYGTMKKKDLTGAVVRANLKDFEKQPNTNILQSLQGTVPGLNIGQTTASGATPSMSIRGTNTISGNNSVLIVLDGIIYNSSLSSINPNDIESVDVLKDASATAVYGAQAANGVLLITTKKGKEGATRVNFSSSYSTSSPTKDLHPMNRAEYLDYTRQNWYDNAFMGPEYTTPNPDFNIADYLPDAAMRDASQPDGISALDHDWWGEGTQTGHIFENRISVSGGTKKMAYLMSYENTTQEGYLKNDLFKRNSIRINLDINPYGWLKFGVQAFASFVNQDGQEPGVAQLMRENPLLAAYDSEGNIIPYPFGTLDENSFMGTSANDKERHNYFFGNFYAEIKLPVKGLTYRINYGNNYRIDKHNYSNPYSASLTGEAYKHYDEYYDYTVDNILSYNHDFGPHSIAATLLYGVSERKDEYTSADSQNFSRLTLGYDNLSLGKEQYSSSSAWNEALLYQMFRLNYNFKNRYLLTTTVRRDGYSGFAKNKKFATFPSVALAWVVSEEPWFNAGWVDQLKLRGGWGISGNQTTRYKSLAKVSSSAAYVFGDGGTTEIGQQVSTMGNDNLKWEKTHGVNFGLDFVVLNGRLSGTFEYYNTTTKDLLYDIAIPTINGYSTLSSNIGKIRNHGVEFTITSRNIVKKDFQWSTTFNISSNKNKIVSLLGKDADGDGKEDDLVASNLFIGQPVSAIYNYKIDGIWQLGDDIPKGYHAGNYRVVDTDTDGKITVDDRVILGKKDPSYRFGILNTFRYKDFSLSFFINSIQGGKNGYMQANSYTIVRGDANALRWNRASELASQYWSPSNPNGKFSRSNQGGTISPTYYEQRNFVRLQDVSLGYVLPKILVSKVGLQDVNLFLSAKNLITITDWDGWDPEAGQDYYGRPVLRSISFGINVTL